MVFDCLLEAVGAMEEDMESSSTNGPEVWFRECGNNGTIRKGQNGRGLLVIIQSSSSGLEGKEGEWPN